MQRHSTARGLPAAACGALLLLLACGCSAHTWQPGIPTGWDRATADIGELPRRGSTVVVDPWNYTQRLSLYKIMLNATRAQLNFDEGWGNPLWGLPLQFSWQHDTGRLLSTSSSDRINGTSWWGGCNYFLSVLPFLASYDAGVVDLPAGADSLEMLPPPPGAASQPPSFCLTPEQCRAAAPNATAAWTSFFARARKGQPPVMLNESLALLWNAHLHSLHEGVPSMTPLLRLLPSQEEAHFGTGWANLVDFVAALQFDVNYNKTNFLQGLIVPPRLLRDTDHPPHVSDFSGAQNRALLVADVFLKAQQVTKGGFLRLFQRLCCTVAGRADALAAAVGFLQHPVRDVGAVIRVIEDLVASHPC